MSDFTVGSIMNVAAYGLGIGTLFFSFFGIRAERDFFLMMGLVACIVGDTIFAFYLFDQGDEEEGRNNDTLGTLYVMFTLLAVYATYCQFEQFREPGCMADDEDDDEEEPLPALRPGERLLRPATKPAALADAPAAGNGGARRR